NDLLFAWFTNGSNFSNENFSVLNSSYKKRELSGTGNAQCYSFSNCVESADLFASGTTTTNATANLSVSDIWSATLIAFKSSSSESGGGTTQPDTASAGGPTGLSVTGVATSSISLAWTGRSDNVGVTGYKIYRGGTQVATSTSTSYTD